MKRGVSMAALAAAIAMPIAAQAAEPAAAVSQVTVTAGALPPDLNLTLPTTAGGRLNLTSLQTPASVSVVDGDLIRNLGIQSISEASTLATGVSQVPFPGTGNNAISARGFYGVNSIVQTYDGMQLYNGGGVIDFPFDTWNVERIEVLNGPASVLYGAGAIGGSLNVVSKKPQATAMQQGEVSYGSFNTFRIAGDTTGPIAPGLTYRLNASYRHSDGWVDRGQSKSVAVSGALRYEFSPQLATTVFDDFGNITPSSYEGTPTLNNGPVIKALRFNNYNVADARINFNENRLRWNLDWRPSDNFSFQNDLYLISHARKYFETYTYAYLPATNQVRRTTFRDIDGFQSQWGDHGYATLRSNFGAMKNELVVGFDVNHGVYDRRDNTGGGSFPGTNLVSATNFDPGNWSIAGVRRATALYQVTIKQRGAFAQDRLQLTDQLSLVAGVRADHYQTDRIDHITHTTAGTSLNGTGWNVGAVYQPQPNLSLYAQYATADDPVTSLASIGVSQLVFNLSPGHQVEAGIKQSALGGRLEWTVAAYKIVKQDLIAPTLANPAISEQVGQQSSKGIEASVSIHVTPKLRIDANGTVLDAKFDDFFATVAGKRTQLAGKIPQFVPEKTANLRAVWDFLPKWQARVSYRYVDTRWSDNTNTFKMPAYALYNAGVRWMVTPRISLNAQVDNVFDKVYVASTYAGVGSQMILGSPRSYSAALNFAF